jgi:hypothetical protein
MHRRSSGRRIFTLGTRVASADDEPAGSGRPWGCGRDGVVDPQDNRGEEVALGLVEGGAGANEVGAGAVGRAGAEKFPPAQDGLDGQLFFGACRPVDDLAARAPDDLHGLGRTIRGSRFK